jgi:predicted nucleic acid-binding protein
LIVVANSSVLIALCRIRMLELLHQRFPEGVFIPGAVWREVVEGGKGQPGSKEVSSSPWIKVKEVEDKRLVSLLRMELDQGEAEAIVLASERGLRPSCRDSLHMSKYG